MPDSHVKFHSSDGKRLVLIVDDEMINREILKGILSEKYDILLASTGQEVLDTVRTKANILSLILLDLILPDIHGLEILRQLKADARFSKIPVIVMTSDRESEVESLSVGASDFIPKPYPLPKVILARVRRTIELSEDRDIIRSTERDQLTGLYHTEYFYRYAERYDLFHKEQAMDAVLVDVNHFHLINERYGRTAADELLRSIGNRLRDGISDSAGIVCRREADTFLIYCPHRTDYEKLLESAAGAGIGKDGKTRIRLRMGIYSEVDKNIDVERRFDRAKMAADTVRGSFTKAIAVYDNKLHDAELYAEQLLEDFQEAIEQKQFMVYYQPKFDIRPSEPVLGSAEALVRWKHPRLGMISPGLFIPLFEKNGMIQELDNYVWREAAAQIRRWKEELGAAVPVSVNVSRVDMLDPELVEKMCGLVEENGLGTDELYLEITESAYTQDSEQIISTVNRLREKGFLIEMDDFGSGYSSLNMISTLPIDALKLDMQFIRNAFGARKDTRMLEVVFDIADSLSVPTIAEGVETAEQLFALKAMGCDIVQGYYFSKPVPAEEFVPFLRKKQEDLREKAEAAQEKNPRLRARMASVDQFTYNALHDAQTGLYNHSGFEMLLKDADQNHIAVLVAEIENYSGMVRETADKVVQQTARLLRRSFRSVDYVCRLSSGEFAVIMTRTDSSMRDLVYGRVERLNRDLAGGNGAPPASLSVGVAFADRANPRGTILEDADAALSRMREARHTGCVIY